MKRAANFLDKNRIKEMSADGKSVDYISKALRIDPKVVEAFAPPKKAKANPKQEGIIDEAG